MDSISTAAVSMMANLLVVRRPCWIRDRAIVHRVSKSDSNGNFRSRFFAQLVVLASIWIVLELGIIFGFGGTGLVASSGWGDSKVSDVITVKMRCIFYGFARDEEGSRYQQNELLLASASVLFSKATWQSPLFDIFAFTARLWRSSAVHVEPIVLYLLIHYQFTLSLTLCYVTLHTLIVILMYTNCLVNCLNEFIFIVVEEVLLVARCSTKCCSETLQP